MTDEMLNKLKELAESDSEWYRKCHKNQGTAILCICDECRKELAAILGE